MDLSSRFSRWRDSTRRPVGGPRADGGNPVKLTVGGRLFRVQVEMARPGRTDGAGPEASAAPRRSSRSTRPALIKRRSEPRFTQADQLLIPATRVSPSPPIHKIPGRTALPLASGTSLTRPSGKALRSVASPRTFAAGARLMEEGERADYVMVVLGGKVEIRLHVDGTERVVAVRGLGQLVGERAALKVSVRSATVVALEMVSALVVQTKDFAAFISAHPRVLDIVQNQQYQRRAAGAPGYQYDDNADDARAGRVNGGQSEENHSAGYSRKGRKTLTGENCTVVLTDVADYGARIRTDNDRLLIREALFRMTQRAMQGFPGAQSEDRGDSFLTVVPPDASTARVLDQLMKELPQALERYNGTQGEPGPVQVAARRQRRPGSESYGRRVRRGDHRRGTARRSPELQTCPRPEQCQLGRHRVAIRVRDHHQARLGPA